MTDQDRIRLAEAMGWRKGDVLWISSTLRPLPLGGYEQRSLPDPEHDANDDYAVLAWIRNGLSLQRWNAFKDALDNLPTDGSAYSWSYQIGDYARAALSVIQRPEEAGKVLGDK